jgi:hypothetical protein
MKDNSPPFLLISAPQVCLSPGFPRSPFQAWPYGRLVNSERTCHAGLSPGNQEAGHAFCGILSLLVPLVAHSSFFLIKRGIEELPCFVVNLNYVGASLFAAVVRQSQKSRYHLFSPRPCTLFGTPGVIYQNFTGYRSSQSPQTES